MADNIFEPGYFESMVMDDYAEQAKRAYDPEGYKRRRMLQGLLNAGQIMRNRTPSVWDTAPSGSTSSSLGDLDEMRYGVARPYLSGSVYEQGTQIDQMFPNNFGVAELVRKNAALNDPGKMTSTYRVDRATGVATPDRPFAENMQNDIAQYVLNDPDVFRTESDAKLQSAKIAFDRVQGFIAEQQNKNNGAPLTQADVDEIYRKHANVINMSGPIQDALKSALANRNLEPTLVNLMSKDGSQRKQIYRNDPKLPQLLKQGWTKVSEATADNQFLNEIESKQANDFILGLYQDEDFMNTVSQVDDNGIPTLTEEKLENLIASKLIEAGNPNLKYDNANARNAIIDSLKNGAAGYSIDTKENFVFTKANEIAQTIRMPGNFDTTGDLSSLYTMMNGMSDEDVNRVSKIINGAYSNKTKLDYVEYEAINENGVPVKVKQPTAVVNGQVVNVGNAYVPNQKMFSMDVHDRQISNLANAFKNNNVQEDAERAFTVGYGFQKLDDAINNKSDDLKNPKLWASVDDVLIRSMLKFVDSSMITPTEYDAERQGQSMKDWLVSLTQKQFGQGSQLSGTLRRKFISTIVGYNNTLKAMSENDIATQKERYQSIYGQNFEKSPIRAGSSDEIWDYMLTQAGYPVTLQDMQYRDAMDYFNSPAMQAYLSNDALSEAEEYKASGGRNKKRNSKTMDQLMLEAERDANNG